MNKNNSTIVINGRHYDARTGKAVSRQGLPATAASKPEVAGHETAAPAPPARRKAGRHIAAHQPKPARTLMRQAVKKPSGSLKRRITAQSRLEIPAARPHHQAGGHSPARQIYARHSHHRAISANKGQLISHFSPNLFTTVKHPAAARPAPQNSPVPRAVMQTVFAPRKPQTTAELLEYAVQQASGPGQPLPRNHHRKLFRRHVGAAVKA